MTDLFEKSIRTLELPAVLEKLAAKAVSDAAKERCLRLTPATDTQEVLHLLDIHHIFTSYCFSQFRHLLPPDFDTLTLWIWPGLNKP